MRCVVSGMRNAVGFETWCYGDMVIWPALQARAFALVIIFNCAMVRRLSLSFVVVVRHTGKICGKVRSFVRSFVRLFVVVVRHTQKIHPIVHAAAGARPCPSNGIWRICDFHFLHEKSI